MPFQALLAPILKAQRTSCMIFTREFSQYLTNRYPDKCKPLASQIPNLFCVSSVDSIKKANQLSIGREDLRFSIPSITTPLNIHIQINTSGEASKSGVSPGTDASELVRHVLESCPGIHLLGLMTIGAIARSRETKAGRENEDFVALREERDRLQEEFVTLLKEKGVQALELSMGMSEDFEGAIEAGSDEVRVGSTIFGQRPPKSEAVV